MFLRRDRSRLHEYHIMYWYTIYDAKGFIIIRTTNRELAEAAKKYGII